MYTKFSEKKFFRSVGGVAKLLLKGLTELVGWTDNANDSILSGSWIYLLQSSHPYLSALDLILWPLTATLSNVLFDHQQHPTEEREKKPTIVVVSKQQDIHNDLWPSGVKFISSEYPFWPLNFMGQIDFCLTFRGQISNWFLQFILV